MQLTPSQIAALRHVTEHARSRKESAAGEISHFLAMSNLSEHTYSTAVDRLKQFARVGLQFHPDRLDPNTKTVAEALFEQGVYKNQFETRLSSGSLSAHAGGARDAWEAGLFDGAYTLETSADSERPKYGALQLLPHADGPAPRFGSCYFLLKPTVGRRCTFTNLDSYLEPQHKGTYEEFDDVMAALLNEVFTRNFALGEHDLNIARLLTLLGAFDGSFHDPSGKNPSRNLDHYIEAQVHGTVSLRDDVDILVADPSFKGTQVGSVLESICEKYEIRSYWHAGFAIAPDDVPSDFRGHTMPSLAKRIATKPHLDVSMIGEAARSLRQNPGLWSDRGSYAEVLQELKYLWHVLVKFGKPLSTFTH